MTDYNCRVPGCEFSTTTKVGIQAHARKHKRQYREVTGDQHDDYDDVKDLLAGRVGPDGDLRSSGQVTRDPPGDQATLLESTREQ